MYEGAWKMDDKEKAIFIDVEERVTEGDENEDHDYSDWDRLPDLIMEKIFSYLSMREKYWASMTCKSWYRIFHLPNAWATFTVDDNTLTRRKFNYYSGWEHVLDHYRTMQCLSSVGKHFRRLIFEPMMNFNNLYEFMNMISYYTEKTDEKLSGGVGHSIRALKFIFPCNMKQKAEANNIIIFGTGGQILASLKRLMSNLSSLVELELIDLMLEINDAKFLLDEVCNKCCLQLQTLILVNLTRVPFELLHPGVFLNLNTLVISPQNLGDDVIQLLGFTKLRHLHIKSNFFSPPPHGCRPVSSKVWLQCRRTNPQLSVHVECMNDLLWQEDAPVKSIIFNSPTAMVQTDIVLSAIQYYGDQLEVFAHQGMANFHRPKAFHDRPDSSLVLLCRQCPKLSTLVIRERISTATILLIATSGKQLRNLIIRKNAVIIRTDWPKSNEWTDEFYSWLKIASRKYDYVEKEVSQILGYRWKMLSDKEFRKIRVKPY